MESFALLTDHRCSCGRLLFKAVIRTAWIQVKCRRCGELAHFSPLYARNYSLSTEVLSETDETSGVSVLRDHPSLPLLRSHAVWVRVDALWHIVSASDRFCLLVSSTIEELLGKKIFELFTPECAVMNGDMLINATSEHTPFVLELVAFSGNASYEFRMHGTPHEGTEGYTLVFEEWGGMRK